MDSKQLEQLLKKYDEGQSSLDEERILMEHAGTSGKEMSAWARFVNHHKKTAPDGLAEDLWSSIESGEKRKRRFVLRLVSAAASVLLLITFSLTLTRKAPDEMSYEEKQALLEEALSLFSSGNDKQTTKEIIYEDEFLMIYTDIKKHNNEKITSYN